MDKVFINRRSVRRFSDKDISEADLSEILKAANSAPSAGGMKAREIFSITDKNLKQKLAEAALNQTFIEDVPVVLVFCSHPKQSAIKYGDRGTSLYSTQDATISASFAWLQVVMLGLSACWVGAFDEEKVKKILEIDDGLTPVALLPIGYEK